MKLAPITPPASRCKSMPSDHAKQTMDSVHEFMHYNCCSTIGQFNTPHEVLYSLRGALLQRWKDWDNTGKVHGNINSESIRIANIASSTLGVLFDNNEPGNPVYKSAMTLKGKWPNDEEYIPDYLDDLESFYYVLGFISICFTAPKTYSLDAGPPNPHLNLSKWMLSPRSAQSIREKEGALAGSGFSRGMLSGYFDAYKFGNVLDEMHHVLKIRISERKERRSRGLRLLNRDDEEYRTKSDQDHQAFLDAIDRRLQTLERSWKVFAPPVSDKTQPSQVVPNGGAVALRRHLLRVITGFTNHEISKCDKGRKID